MNYKAIILLTVTVLLTACSKESDFTDSPDSKGVALKLSVDTRATNDPASINQDQTFSSLAIFLYDSDAASTLLQSALLSSFSPVSVKELTVQVKPGTKLLYVIANYAGKTFKLADGSTFTLSQSTTRQQLENLIIESSSGFLPASLLMVSKQTMNIASTDNGKQLNVILRRLQARVDVYAYKGLSFGATTVTLGYIRLHNQVLNSEIKFDYTAGSAQLINPPLLNNQTINTNTVLSVYNSGTVLQPANANAIFYSYQYPVTTLPPSTTTAPWLEINLNANGTNYTYNGYITDNNQVSNKYSLLQNNVYQVVALLETDKKITLNLNILPWDKQNIEYGRPITADDFAFAPWNSSWGGTNAKTMYTNVGGLEDAVFQFELKAPFGAAWCATLTNGLDFTFTSTTAGLSTQAVSSGFTNPGSPAVIAVRATKKWTGDARDTDFYITVEGKEIPINPIIGTQRRYPGTDTRIKITQVASYN